MIFCAVFISRLRFSGLSLALALCVLPLGAERTDAKSENPNKEPVVVEPIDKTLRIDDAPLEKAVRERLQSEHGLNLENVKFSVDHNNVTFRGRFVNVSDANRALETASAVRGVLSVDNLAEITPTPRADNEIQSDIEKALKHDPATRPLHTQVSVENAVVTLSGSVDTWQEKDLARWVSENVRGVRQVQNQIRIVVTPRADTEIVQQIQHRLRGDALLSSDIDVSVQNGVASLRGEVGSVLERNWAIADAWVPGVQLVAATKLKVSSDNPAPRTSALPLLSDEEIRRSIIDGYVFDPRVKAYNPSVTVDQGTVTLTGTVANIRAKQAAGQIAQHTRGVRKVNNELDVRSEAQRSDPEIADDIQAAIKRSPSMKPETIKVSVNESVVSLSGTVDTLLERWIAEDIAARTSGVARVNNKLQVRGAPEAIAGDDYFYYPSLYSHQAWLYAGGTTKKSDADIALGIRNENFWDPFIRGNEVHVTVNQGIATLTGVVQNEFESRLAQENAYRGGAWKVINKLQVQPQSNGVATTN